MIFRLYQSDDKETCLNLLKSNQPHYFNQEDLHEFEVWLDTGQMETYWMLIDRGETVGCGGVFINTERGEAGLAWGMIKRAYHQRGYGKALTEFRLRALAELAPYPVKLCTSQHTYQFYERLGFTISEITPQGFSPDLDRYDMIYIHPSR